MRCCHRYFLLALLSALFCAHTVMAVEVVIETEAPKKVAPVSIDALVAKYQTATDKDAYRIMNQIKQEIARMSRERQRSAIGKVRQSVAQKEDEAQRKKYPAKQTVEKKIKSPKRPLAKRSKKQKKQTGKYKKQIQRQKKQQQKRIKKHQNKMRKTSRHTAHTKKHPDPMSVMNGASGNTDIHEKATSSLGGGSGGFGSGMGDMGSGMGGF